MDELASRVRVPATRIELAFLGALLAAATSDLYGVVFSAPTWNAFLFLAAAWFLLLSAVSPSVAAESRTQSAALRANTAFLTVFLICVEVVRRSRMTPGEAFRSLGAEDNAAWMSQISHMKANDTIPLEFGSLVSLFLRFAQGLSALTNSLQEPFKSEIHEFSQILLNAYSILLVSIPLALHSHMRRNCGSSVRAQCLSFWAANIVLYGVMLLTASYGHLTACLALWLLVYSLAKESFGVHRISNIGWMFLAGSCTVWRPLALFGVLIFGWELGMLIRQFLLSHVPRSEAARLRVKLITLTSTGVILLVVVLLALPTVVTYMKFGGGTRAMDGAMTGALLLISVSLFLGNRRCAGMRRRSVDLLLLFVAYVWLLSLLDLAINSQLGYGTTKLWWVVGSTLIASLFSGLATQGLSWRLRSGVPLVLLALISAVDPSPLEATWRGVTSVLAHDEGKGRNEELWWNAPWGDVFPDNHIAGCAVSSEGELRNRFAGYQCTRLLSSVSQLGSRQQDPPGPSATRLFKDFGLGYISTGGLYSYLSFQSSQLNYRVVLFDEEGDYLGAPRILDLLKEEVLTFSSPTE